MSVEYPSCAAYPAWPSPGRASLKGKWGPKANKCKQFTRWGQREGEEGIMRENGVKHVCVSWTFMVLHQDFGSYLVSLPLFQLIVQMKPAQNRFGLLSASPARTPRGAILWVRIKWRSVGVGVLTERHAVSNGKAETRDLERDKS